MDWNEVYEYAAKWRAQGLSWHWINELCWLRWHIGPRGYYRAPAWLAKYERASGHPPLPRKVDQSTVTQTRAWELFDQEWHRLKHEYNRPVEGPPSAMDLAMNLACDLWMRAKEGSVEKAEMRGWSVTFARRLCGQSDAAAFIRAHQPA